MRKALVLVIVICMICTSISGAAVSLYKNTNFKDNDMAKNLATESPEVNTELLSNINQNVEKYLNFDAYNKIESDSKTVKEVEFPWSNRPIPAGAGDFVDWVINVNYNGECFQKKLDISPRDLRTKFLNDPTYVEKIYFDVDGDEEDDIGVSYSVCWSRVINHVEGIDGRSIRTKIKVDSTGLMNRTALLEVTSELCFNIGLIPVGKTVDVSETPINKINGPLLRILQLLKSRFQNFNFPLINKIITFIMSKLHDFKNQETNEPPVFPAASSDDKILIGMGVSSAAGENIPANFEKIFNIGRKRIILGPTIFEHEINQYYSEEPLGFVFGLKTLAGGSNQPIIDIAFNIEFDPCIYISLQFIPTYGYVYFYFDTKSETIKETRVSFSSRIIKGVGEDIELTLIFDDTLGVSSPGNWISFDIDLLDLKLIYKAKKSYNIGLLVSSPVFSAKAKLVGLPDYIEYYVDADLEITYQQGQYFDASAEASLNLKMSDDLDDIIFYYPKLGSEEPNIEFFKISGVPKTQKLWATTHLNIVNNSNILDFLAEASAGLTMSSDLESIKMFYRKADPEAEDRLFIDIPYGIPQSQEIGAELKLRLDFNNFYNKKNYVFGNIYRDSTGDINEISMYLQGETNPEPTFSVYNIPSRANLEGKLEWNKLKGYGEINRNNVNTVDPVNFNIDIGTFNVNNTFSVGTGRSRLEGHLADPGYIYFHNENEMIGNDFILTDTSTGNQFQISAGKVVANELNVAWDVDFNQTPIPIEELRASGDLELFQNFFVSATFQGKNLDFEGNWEIGESGEFSLDFNQDEPIEINVSDLLPNNEKFDLRGGVRISEDFHFDIKWNFIKGTPSDPGYFKINEDTNDPNFDLIFINFTYKPEGEQKPQYGIEVGATDILLIVWVEWWYNGNPIFPTIQWWIEITGDLYLDLLWKGVWHEDI
jgi:hypothetical protein